MIPTQAFLEAAARHGFDFYTGVPCSYLKALIGELEGGGWAPAVPATNEGDAVAIACGAELGGRRPVVFFQNSGLGNAVNPLTSLAATFRVPVLLLTTWRGEPEGKPDEPQHELMGAITPRMLEAMQVPWTRLPAEPEALDAVLATAVRHLRTASTPYALVVPKGGLGGPVPALPPAGERAPAAPVEGPAAPRPFAPDEVLARVSDATSDAVVVTTTGFTGRALYAVEDRPNQLYMVGSMGCASSLGLGLALARPERRVVVLDGDGALLMRMGALAALGRERPANLTHVLLDNGVHDSTGAQRTLSGTVDAAAVAHACGYPRSRRIDALDELAAELRRPSDGLAFLHVRTEPRSDRELPRPTIRPHEVAARLRAWLAG